jgi:translation initiation factor IF-1
MCGALQPKLPSGPLEWIAITYPDSTPAPDGLARNFQDNLRPGLAVRRFHRRLRALTTHSSTPSEAPKSTGDTIEIEGKIVAVLPGTMFRVQLANGHIVLAHISGKLRKHFIKIAAGDMVKMEMSPYDLEKARITYRMKDTSSTYRPPARRRY